VDEVTGLTVDGRSTPAVAQTVAELLGDPERARTMGTAGRRRVELEYTRPSSAQKLTEIIGRLVAKQDASCHEPTS
jgi:phosphatidyl-myo-inositol dimannoside synthase